MNLLTIFLAAIFSQNNVFGYRFNFSQLFEKPLGVQQDEYSLKDYEYPINFADETPYIREDEYEDIEFMTSDTVSRERAGRGVRTRYENLCRTTSRKVELPDAEYDYLPPSYVEILCKNHEFLDPSKNTENPPLQTCVNPILHCVQRVKSVLMVRRRWKSECWEPFTKQIYIGCECMWPAHIIGDISPHY